MRRTLFILLVVCTLSAMTAVPMLRRAINPDEEENQTSDTSYRKICAPQTPCGWSVYNTQTKRITTNITNSYAHLPHKGNRFASDKNHDMTRDRNDICTCAEGTRCEVSENDETAGTYVLRCHEAPES